MKEEAQRSSSVIVRPPMNQEEFDEKFHFKQAEEEDELTRRLRKLARSYYEPFTSCRLFGMTLASFLPIISWLPAYDFKSNLLQDFIGGFTIGITSIPQGIAYALLARQDAVIGLYTSLFPPLLYMLFGTSRHNSLGSFSVVSLMTGLAVLRLSGEDAGVSVAGADNSTDLLTGKPPATPIEIAATLTLLVGIIQVLMGVCRLSFLTTYLSDQVVAGFTTGASVHVFVSQLKEFFGIRGLPHREGYGYQVLKFYDIVSNLHRCNWMSVGISCAVVVVLVLGKDYINPWLKRKYKVNVPIPWELIVVIVGTVATFVFNLRTEFKVKTVGTMPTGMPQPLMPRWELLPSLISDALGVVVVSVAVHMSLGKMFAKKMGYEIDPGQELYALGFCSIGCGFLPVHPVACSLGRTIVSVEVGTKTQLATIPGALLVLSVILYLGKFMETLPMCVLSALIVVALKGMTRKFLDLKTLWPLSKIDFSIWIVSFVTTVCIDVTEGLAISILYALFTTIMREQWSRWHLLGSVQGTADYRDSERYEDVYFYHGICMFRFDSPLLFTNVERFKRSVAKAYGQWLRSHEFYVLSYERTHMLMEMEHDVDKRSMQSDDSDSNSQKSLEKKDDSWLNGEMLSRHFVVDCSGFTFVDYMGVSALKEVYSEMRSKGILVYFAAAKAPVRELFESCGFYSFVPKENFYPTIRDAVAIARMRQQTKGEYDRLYRLEHDRLSEIISTTPMS